MNSPSRAGDPAPDRALARLVHQLTDHAIVGLDLRGHVVSWNAGAVALTGLETAEAVGREAATLFPDADSDGVDAAATLPGLLAAAVSGGSVKHAGWRGRPDGTEYWADTVVSALHGDAAAPDARTTVGFALVVHDRTTEHAAELSLRRSAQRFRLLVEQVSDYAIIGLDPSGAIETWNSGAERLKGYRAEDVIGRHFSLFYPPQAVEDGLPERLLAEAVAGGRTGHSGWRVRRDGTRFWGDVVITAIRDEGRLVGFGKVTRDLTARKRFEDAREMFFDTFAHDFRAPVAAIAGFAQALEGATADEQRICLDRIQTNTARLAAMTTDLVEHSRTRATGPAAAPVPLDVGVVVAQTVEALGDEHDPARVRLHAPPASSPPLIALGEATSLERVVVNLVSNALKYSPTGSPVIVEVRATADGSVEVVVSDRGRGIAAGDLPTIFDEFERGRLATDDGGTGLGLASVRRSVERMAGEVAIASEPGRGTTVTVTLATPDATGRPGARGWSA